MREVAKISFLSKRFATPATAATSAISESTELVSAPAK